ncbi:hypothetical protein G7Y89_g13513 [Cudoniella acicularis]|uniref:alpha-1,2-Mannosidase n=1 Tax=Cudoniella acicularis TaxID=354080 RepID=A0A8H4R9H2_9HELO|nr:hypothetical protein G7Y89_g13513 [Cudoniella acicularis]
MLVPSFASRRTPILLGITLFAIYVCYFYSQPLFTSASKPFPRPPPKDDKFDWSTREEKFPVKFMKSLPTGKAVKIPTIQHKFGGESPEDKKKRLERRDAVKNAFDRSWKGYKDHAWLKDELLPISGGSRNHFGGWAATLVDSLDTLWIMGMKSEFEEAVQALKAIDFTKTDVVEINVYETTIRYLGGLLSAHDLTNGKYPILLQKAVEIGDMLYAAFDTPNRLPITRWPWQKSIDNERQEADHGALIAEVGSLSLEFTRLSQLSGDPKFFDAIQRVYDILEKEQSSTKLPGMWPIVINAKEADFTSDSGFSLGAMADSVYEYLPKQYLLLGGRSKQPMKMYQSAITAAKETLFFRPSVPNDDDILISGSVRVQDAENYDLDPQVQHLSCFAGGMVGLGSKIFSSPSDLPIAQKLVDGCIWAYKNMPSGIMPEVFKMTPCVLETGCEWDTSEWKKEVMVENESIGPANLGEKIGEFKLVPGVTSITDRRYVLRPEAIESIFVLYRITGSVGLLDSAWDMFSAIEKHTKTQFGNAALDDITSDPPKQADSMESFWMAQTLKYFYLAFTILQTSPGDLIESINSRILLHRRYDLLTIGLEGFSPNLRLVTRPEDPLVYQLFPLFFFFAFIFLIYCASIVTFELFVWVGQQDMLAILASIHPKERQGEFRRLCEVYQVRLRFEEDLESEYEDDNEKEVLIDLEEVV